MSDKDLQLFYDFLTGSETRESGAPFPKELVDIVVNELQASELSRIILIGSQLPIRLSDDDVISLVECLVAASIQISELHFLYHNITDVGLEEICRLLRPEVYNSTGQGLLVLDLTGNEITGNSIELTPLMSKYDCPLITLNLSSNPISSTGHKALASMVNLNQTMKRLIINSCGFNLQGLSDFLSKMAENKALETLSLDRPVLPNVQEGGVIEQFAKIIPASRSLGHLSLKHHLLYDHHAKVLADALFINDRMISLNLESNCIGVIGAEALASCILKQQQRSLQYLGLSYNKIGNDGAIALAEAIKGSATNLRVLTLKNNSIGPIGLQAIAHALETSTNLEQLWLFGNNFDNNNGMMFHELLQNRLSYCNLSLDITVYVVDGNYMIAEK